MVLYLIKDSKYAFEQLPVVEWVFSWFVLRRPARTCLLFQGRRDEVSDLRFPSAHDRMRLGEVTKVKGTCPLPELRKRCLKTTKTMHSDCWAHFLPPDLTIHLKPACDPWPSRAQSEHLANIFPWRHNFWPWWDVPDIQEVLNSAVVLLLDMVR